MGFLKNNLLFREVEESDLLILRKWRNNPDMAAGWHSPVSVQTPYNQEEWYRSLNANNRAYIVEEISQVIGLLRFQLYPNQQAAITGIDVAPNAHSKGYGKRILSAGADYILRDLGYHRVTGEALDTNFAAQKIISACGFTQEGRYRDYVWRDGKWHSWLVYSLLQQEVIKTRQATTAEEYVEGMREYAEDHQTC